MLNDKEKQQLLEELEQKWATGFGAALERIRKAIEELNERDKAREIERLAHESDLGEYVEDEYLNMRTPRAALVLAAGVSGQILPVNAARKYAILTNIGLNPAHLSGSGPAVVGLGPILVVNGTLNISRLGMDIRSAIHGVSTLGTTISFWEG